MEGYIEIAIINRDTFQEKASWQLTEKDMQ